MKDHSAGSVVEANLKLIKDSAASEKVKTDSKTLRKADRSRNLRSPDLDGKVMNEGRNIAPIAYDNHLPPTPLPVYSDISGLRSIDNTERGPRIDVDPDFMILDRNRDDRHQVAFVEDVWELDKRHTMSSSLGTFSTEGIFWGSISRAFSSTSPTAAH